MEEKNVDLDGAENRNKMVSISVTCESYVQQLERDLAIVKERNSELHRKLELYENTSNKTGSTKLKHSPRSFVLANLDGRFEDNTVDNAKGSVFALSVSTKGLDKIIDPRQTVISLMLSREKCDALFQWYKQYGYFLLFPLVTGHVLAVIGIIGWYPDLGYGAIGVLPGPIFSLLYMNLRMLRSLISNFDFWILFSLVCLALSGLIDAVSTSERSSPRIFALVIYLVTMIITICTDAKIPQKQRNYTYAIAMFFATSIPWVVSMLWWFGQFVDITQHIINVADITIDLQSTAISSLVTYAALMTRYFVIIATSREANPLLVCRPMASYRKLEVSPVTSQSSIVEIEVDNIV
jgi:hypothetical protein